MSLKGLAEETLRIVDNGAYTTAGGHEVHMGDAVRAAIDGTRLYACAG